MRRRAFRNSREHKITVRGVVLGIIGLLMLAGIVFVYVKQSLSARAIDQATNCPKDRFDSITVVLIDLTDQINPVQAAALKNALRMIRNEVPIFGRLEIYPLEPVTTSAIKPRFVGCNPGSAQDVDNPWTGNRDLADKHWLEQFANKVDQVISELESIPPQANSPILEGIQSIAVTALGSPLGRTAADKRIVIISDMIHHTSDFSMYRGVPKFNEFKSTQYYQRIRASLREARVDVFLVVRETTLDIQQPPLYKFWVDSTAASNGFLQRWEPLQ